jgi:hypothetical protein
MDEVQFRWDRHALFRGAAAFAIIGALGVAAPPLGDAGIWLLGLAWAAVFGYGAVRMWRLRSEREPVITIGAAGLRDHRIRDAVIPWGAIAHVEGFEAEGVPFVGLSFHDRKAVLAAARPLVRVFAPIQALLQFPEVSVSMALLDGSEEQLLAAIAPFLKAPSHPTRQQGAAHSQ